MWNWRLLTNKLYLQPNLFFTEDNMLSFIRIECFAYSFWSTVNTVSILRRHKGEIWDGTGFLSHTGHFGSFVPLTAWTHKAVLVPHRLEFIYGGKSIEKRHISICFLTPPQGESFVYLFKLRSAIRPGHYWTWWVKKLITSLPCGKAITSPRSFAGNCMEK